MDFLMMRKYKQFWNINGYKSLGELKIFSSRTNLNNWGIKMEKGKVKFFNDEKGFGFITPENGESDIFVHVSAVASGTLNQEDTVEYNVGQGQKGPCAVDVKVI